MAIRIKRNEAGNCIEFQGSSNPVYWNACLSGEVDSSDTTKVNVINDIKTAQSGTTQYEFFRIPFSDFADEDGASFSSAQEVADYVTLKGNVSAPEDINVGYKGVFDASTNLDPTDASPVNGDWYYIGTEGTIGGVLYKVNDIIKYSETSTSWEKIENKNATVTELQNSALDQYNIHVDADYTGTIRNGTALHPYNDLLTAINASSANDSILVKGVNIITSEIVLPHSLSFYGANGAEIKFANYDATNGDIFSFEGDMTQKFVFKDITFKNAGGYGLLIKKTDTVEIRSCKFYNNGWNGTGLHTVLDSATSGVLGYDSTNTELQSFYASANASNGGAVRLQECTKPLIRESRAENNLRGFRVQDCGINGGGFVIENQSLNNIESGIYLAAGSLGGCQNITVTINYSSYNANNGLLCIGGINNKFSQNEVRGNWNAGACAWGAANYTLRDCGIYDNNRSQYNGIGNVGDAKASIQIKDAYNLLGTQITYNSGFRFIAQILSNQVHYTGLGSSSEKNGVLITSAVGNIPDNPKNIITIDNIDFIGQDYAINLGEVDVTNLRLDKGDNSYKSIGIAAVKPPLNGKYSELPFSNHVMQVPEVDIVVDTLKQTIALHEGVGGNVINVYSVNELQAIDKGTHADIIQKSSNKIQLRGLSLGDTYVNGVVAGSNVQTMTNTINSLFEMDLVEYKNFLETEVGVETEAPTITTWYYLVDEQGKYNYPLFKTENEANSIDAFLGGSGTSHAHTYANDLSNTTWYMPDSNNHMGVDEVPVNGLFNNVIPNVIWNLWSTNTTDPVAPTAPVFNDASYNVLEGGYVNIGYRGSQDTDIYAITNIPSWISNNGNSLIGYAPSNLSVDDVITIDVTRSNANGSDSGVITLRVYDDVVNDPGTSDTDWNKALDFSGSNQYAVQVSSHSGVNPWMMSQYSVTVGGNSTLGYTATGTARPWAASIVFNADGNNSNQHIWNAGEGANSTNDNIYLRLSSSGELFFGWGRDSGGKNECKLDIGGAINSSLWYGVYIASTGERLSASNATSSNLADCFDIRIMNSNDNFNSVFLNQSTPSNWSLGSTGARMDRGFSGNLSIGGRDNNRSFRGKVASFVMTTLKQNVLMPTDSEIKTMIIDPVRWMDDYKVGKSYRTPNLSSNSSNWQKNDYSPSWSTQVWLMGDGTSDSYSNMIRNQVFPADQNYGKLNLNSMVSNDIENVSITGITSNADIVNFNGNNYNFGSIYNNGGLINIVSTGTWSAILPQLSEVPIDYTITFRNITNTTYVGSIVPYGSETIDNILGAKDLGGKVEATLKKVSSSNWQVLEVIQFEEYVEEQFSNGNTTTINQNYNGGNLNLVFDFTDSDIIILNHDIGGIPLVQVWVEDGQGGYTDIDVDVDHEWDNMLSSTINLGQIESGKLVYIYNQ